MIRINNILWNNDFICRPLRLGFSSIALCGLLLSASPVQADSGNLLPTLPGGKVIDLSYRFDEGTIYWPTAEGFKLDIDFRGMTPSGFYYEANSVKTAEHGGTHLDAPSHFAEGAWHTDQIPLNRLMGPAVLVDVTQQVADNRDYQVTPDDLQAWERANGALPEGTILLIRTGFGSHWPDRKAYLGTEERGDDAVAKLSFPGLSEAAANWLVKERKIHAIGLDTASIDPGSSQDFMAHRILFKDNIPAFENLANLDQLPEQGFSVIALPMKIGEGSGGPLRVVAIVAEDPAKPSND